MLKFNLAVLHLLAALTPANLENVETKFHLQVRAVVHHNGRFLAVRAKNSSHSFFPGGHVETGESAAAALQRETMEECGRKCEIKEYLGAIENAWVEGGAKQWEITHFFHVTIPDIDSKPDIVSLEADLEFFWAAPEEFIKMNLLPMPLRDLAKAWSEGDRKIWWASAV